MFKRIFLTLTLFGTLVLTGCSIIDSDDDNVDEVLDTYTIDSMHYSIKNVEFGTFSTKSEDREYIEAVYTNDNTNETYARSFNRDRIQIGNITEIINTHNNEFPRPELYLTKQEYLDFFHTNDIDDVFQEDNDENTDI